jgi:hypothetical protein
MSPAGRVYPVSNYERDIYNLFYAKAGTTSKLVASSEQMYIKERMKKYGTTPGSV